MATVVARMSGRHALDSQHAAAATHLGYQYVLVVVIEQRLLVKGPAYGQWQVALGQRALVRYILAEMRGLSVRGKGSYLGQYF